MVSQDITLVRGIASDKSSGMTVGSDDVSDIQLNKTCRKGLKLLGITSLFPVQKICAKLILERLRSGSLSPYDCDLCVSAATGQGKTLAYLLPVIHGISSRPESQGIQALIVLPTRDLAQQVAAVAKSFPGIKVSCLVGQQSMTEERTILSSTPHIVVATIGRLIDHLVLGSIDLSVLLWLVVDEADRMLSQSDLDKWSIILNAVPESSSSACQRLLFSATMTSNPQKLNKLKLTRPLFVSVGSSTGTNVPASITHRYIVVPNKSMKVRCLLRVLEQVIVEAELGHETVLGQGKPPVQRCLIFCRTNENVQSLSSLLQSLLGGATSQITAMPFSGNLSAKSRDSMLKKFAGGKINVLISTDVITRGIDIPDIDLVINYDVPQHCTTYIHRAGRTGRAMRDGNVLTICESKEMRHFRKEVIAQDTAIMKSIQRYNMDFSTFMKHSELESLTKGDDQE